MILDLFVFALAVDCLLYLFFFSGPLFPVRRRLVSWTPFLFSKGTQTHLFDCPYCLGFWFSLPLFVFYFLFPSEPVILSVRFLAVYRLASFIHLLWRLASDYGLNLILYRTRK